MTPDKPTSLLSEWLPRLETLPASERAGMRARLTGTLRSNDLSPDGRLETTLLLAACGVLDDGFTHAEMLVVLRDALHGRIRPELVPVAHDPDALPVLVDEEGRLVRDADGQAITGEAALRRSRPSEDDLRRSL